MRGDAINRGDAVSRGEATTDGEAPCRGLEVDLVMSHDNVESVIVRIHEQKEPS